MNSLFVEQDHNGAEDSSLQDLLKEDDVSQPIETGRCRPPAPTFLLQSQRTTARNNFGMSRRNSFESSKMDVSISGEISNRSPSMLAPDINPNPGEPIESQQEHEVRIQEQFINKLYKNVEQVNEVKKLEKDLNKRMLRRQLTENDGEIIVHRKKLVLVRKSLNIFDIKSRFRYSLIYLLEWKQFENWNLGVILLNSISLAVYDYSDINDLTERNQIVNISGIVFTVLFTLEFLAKIIAHGAIMHRRSYFKNGWNWLDFMVVIVGWLEIIPNLPNLKAIRTFRVLRPLRTINSIPSLKKQVESLMKSLAQLVNVLLFFLFFFVFFGILGMDLFKGQFFNRCRLTQFPDENGNWPIDETQQRVCSKPDDIGWFQCPPDQWCGAPQDYGLSQFTQNLSLEAYGNYGLVTFDTIPQGFNNILQTLTLENWSFTMYQLMDSGAPAPAIILQLAIVFIGAYVLQNVILSIIVSNYSDTHNSEIKQQVLEDSNIILSDESFTVNDVSLVQSYQNSGSLDKANRSPKSRKNNVDQGYTINEPQPVEPELATPRLVNDLSRQNTVGRIKFKKHSNQSNNQENNESGVYSPKEQSAKNQFVLPLIQVKKISEKIIEIDSVIKNERRPLQEEEELIDESHNLSIEDIQQQQPKRVHLELRKQRSKTDSNLQQVVQILDLAKLSNSSDSGRLQPKKQPISNQPSQVLNVQEPEFQKQTSQTKILNENAGKTIKLFFLKVCLSRTFSFFVLLLIILNTLILALDRYPLDKNEKLAYDDINTFLTWCFFFEMVIKIAGLGTHYIRDRINIFDAIIVLITTAENISELVLTSRGYQENVSISSLRVVRLFRFFRVAAKLKGFQAMLQKIAISIHDISIFSILMFLFMYTMTLLGLELYSNRVKFDAAGNLNLVDGVSPRPNFDDFLQAFIGVFVYIIGDNWPNYMYYNQIASGDQCMPFFYSFVILGKHVLLNLFLAILLENFDNLEPEGTDSTSTSSNQRKMGYWESLRYAFRRFLKQSQVQALGPEYDDDTQSNYTAGMTKKESGIDCGNSENPNRVRLMIEKKNSTLNQNRAVSNDHLIILSKEINPYVKKNTTVKFKPEDSQKLFLMEETDRDQFAQSPDIHKRYGENELHVVDSLGEGEEDLGSEDQEGQQNFKLRLAARQEIVQSGSNSSKHKFKESQSIVSRKKRLNLMESVIPPKEQQSLMDHGYLLEGKSLFFFGPDNIFRIKVNRIVTYYLFDTIILSVIGISTITMAVDNPLNDPNGFTASVIGNLDIVYTIIFLVEALLKIIQSGFLFNGKQSYLRIPWNIMDFLIVSFSILSLALTSVNIPFIKVIRMIRVLRPLRMVSRNEGLKIAVVSLLNALPAIKDAVYVALVIILLYAIMCVTYFKGKFYNCLSRNVQGTDPIVTKWDCLNMGGDWVNPQINFDSFPMAFIALFQLMQTESWAEVLWEGTDSVDIDFNPVRNNNLGWAFFFMTYMVIGHLFMLNLFVSIVVNSYYTEKEKLYRNDVLTKYQKVWLSVQTMCLKEEPEELMVLSNHPVKRLCQKFAEEDSWFDYFITVCILLNTIIMCIDWLGCPQYLLDTFEDLNYVFTAIFTIEIFIKFAALGYRGYYGKGWNIFDFIIVAISWITLILTQFGSSKIGPQQTMIARTLRIMRMFRLIAKAKFLRIIFNTIVFTFPGLSNVGALMFLLLFIFAILGMQLFATIGLQSNLDYHGNFQYFGVALLTLLRFQTGESWPDVLQDIVRQRQINFDCDPNASYDSIQQNGGIPNGCGTQFGYVYFVLFILIVPVIFLNLFIAVVLTGFSNSSEEEGFEIFKHHVGKFKIIWKRYDPNATGFIDVNQMASLIMALEKETDFITVLLNENRKLVDHFIALLQIPSYHSFHHYYFQDVLTLLSKKYIAHKYVIDKLTHFEMKDDIDEVTAEKEYLEKEFEDEMDDIQEKARMDRIQLIHENTKHTTRYHKRMFDKVDVFEGNIYDSGYIIFVPILQKRIRPWFLRFKERRRLALQEQQLQDQENEELKIQLEAVEAPPVEIEVLQVPQTPPATTQNYMLSPRGSLIIETGSQILSRFTGNQSASGEQDVMQQNLDGSNIYPQQQERAFPSAYSRSLNDSEIANLTRNVKGQTTGEVGGTLFNLVDDGQDNSQLGTNQRDDPPIAHPDPDEEISMEQLLE